MSTLVAVVSPENTDLKREALLFDHIACISIDRAIQNYPELEWLVEEGIVFEPKVVVGEIDNESGTVKPLLHHCLNSEKYARLVKAVFAESKVVPVTGPFSRAGDFILGIPQDTRIVAAVLTDMHTIDNAPIDAIPIFSSLVDFDAAFHPGNAQVIRVVLSQLPMPSELTSWEDILTFRQDEEAKGTLVALRRWMRKLAREDFSQDEIEAELEYLIHRYVEYLQYHRIKFRTDVLQTALSLPFEVAENILKIKWSNAVASLFKVRRHQLELIKAEMDAPGRDIAYVIEARKRFCNDA